MSPLGLCIPKNAPELSKLQAERLAALNLSHLRVDIYLQDAAWQAQLKEAGEQARQLGCQLEIAIHLTHDANNQLKALKEFTSSNIPPVARWIIFHIEEKSTTAKWIRLARQYLDSALWVPEQIIFLQS